MSLPLIPAYMPPPAALFADNRLAWTPEPVRLALLVHDMQQYFCAPFGNTEPLISVTSNIAKLLKAARLAAVPVFYTAQKGDQFRPDRGLQADFWGPGMRASAGHEQIIDALSPAGGDHVLVKHRYSAFQRSNLGELMRARGRDQLMIAGIYAHIGCLCTATDAFQRDIQPFAIADAQADFDADRHHMAMRWMAGCSAKVIDTDTALTSLSARDGDAT